MAIIVQVNVLNCDQNPSRGKPESFGWEKVSRKQRNDDLKNEILLLGEIHNRKKNNLRKSVNVTKFLKESVKRLKETLSGVEGWILNKSRKWKNVFQISLFTILKINNEFFYFLANVCSDKRETNTCQLTLVNLTTLALTLYITEKLLNSFISNNSFLKSRWLTWLGIMISSRKMLSITIYLELLRQNIKSNPGMETTTKKLILSVITFNTNGLGDKKKLKRLLTKVGPLVNKGGIILLQETHLKDTSYLSSIWKHNFASNCSKTNSAGVIILYNKEYETLEKFSDEKGRNLIVAIEKEDLKFIISNSYFPNDHREGIAFAEETYLKILEFQHKYPDHLTIAGGDLNVCMNSLDSLNRNGSTAEVCLSETITDNNKITNMVDSYRALNAEGGYTWKRGSCYSRLDYIFVSTHLLSKIASAVTDWAFEASDHAAVHIKLKFEDKPIKGPGIIKVNTKILENPNIVKQIGNEIKSMMEQTDSSWNPHAKLEFLKVVIRSVFSSKVSEIRKLISTEIVDLEIELNQFEEFKIATIEHLKTNTSNINDKTEKIDIAINNLKSKLTQQRKKLSDSQAFKSKAKWFEYGEKSNKFFLSLLKNSQSQRLITRIKNESEEYVGQEEVTRGITEFYEKLYKENVYDYPKDDDFYSHCPKLTNEQMNYVDSELNNTDLLNALKTCSDSSPGPDGIPYSVYKTYWDTVGPVILDSWKYSVQTETLPPSHYKSIITLLPKEGKNTNDIKNWRPITLSNCDSKIITKALSVKISKVLDSILDVSQTAYIPGRSVADNLRSNFYMKNLCDSKDLDSVLISLDAKKAFDSVSHKYIEETLRAYGFGTGFINIFKILYKDITARVLINGFQSKSIEIKRGVKQGDALSCALFIICIDPLLRNLNESKIIEGIKINRGSILFKAGAYADDVSVICKNLTKSIQGVFYEYERLTKRSGLELNADKTEILRLNCNDEQKIRVKYLGNTFSITTVNKLKICGLHFCNSRDKEYELNVLDKIKKLNYKIKQWTPRHLTIEGKILIIKTFGLSQLIYNMQSYYFNPVDIKNAEKLIFNFIWSTNDNNKGIDRISRPVMKNNYEEGGMNVTDIECLDRSLKLRQFIRAHSSNHAIAKIQTLLTGNNRVMQEYHSVTNQDSVCALAQDTLNIIADYNREQYKSLEPHEYETDKILIDEVASIDLLTYLKRKKRLFSICIAKPLIGLGLTTLGELTQAYEHETDKNRNVSMSLVINSFPKELIDISKCYNEELNSTDSPLRYLTLINNKRLALEIVSTKELQLVLKKALKKIETTNFKEKLTINEYDTTNITIFRKHCKNAKLRNIYFRLIHNDFFTHSRMKRYKMTTTDECPRCKQIETTKHLLWECEHSEHIWNLYNNLMNKLGRTNCRINNYNEVYTAGETAGITTIKIRLIQEMIQIRRPTNWDEAKLQSVVDEIKNIEHYNYKMMHCVDKYDKKWNLTRN